MSITSLLQFQEDLKEIIFSNQTVKDNINDVIYMEHEDLRVATPYILIDFKSSSNLVTEYVKGYILEFGVSMVTRGVNYLNLFSVSGIIQEKIETTVFPINRSYEVVGMRKTKARMIRERNINKLEITYRTYLRFGSKEEPEEKPDKFDVKLDKLLGKNSCSDPQRRSV